MSLCNSSTLCTQVPPGQSAYTCYMSHCNSSILCTQVPPGQSAYTCYMCRRQFLSLSDTKLHLATHTSDPKLIRPYACTFAQCTKAFHKSSDLKRHLRIHTGEKPYSCSMCGHSTNQLSNLKIHIQAKHPEMLQRLQPELDKQELNKQ